MGSSCFGLGRHQAPVVTPSPRVCGRWRQRPRGLQIRLSDSGGGAASGIVFETESDILEEAQGALTVAVRAAVPSRLRGVLCVAQQEPWPPAALSTASPQAKSTRDWPEPCHWRGQPCGVSGLPGAGSPMQGCAGALVPWGAAGCVVTAR